mmetsp:Transcript_17179/g.49748  ORF Transcript_17179/g.49748 Transcript_17179/m.49748 type:complete len:290 (+) Transcript_17179:1563-2432(+)
MAGAEFGAEKEVDVPTQPGGRGDVRPRGREEGVEGRPSAGIGGVKELTDADVLDGHHGGAPRRVRSVVPQRIFRPGLVTELYPYVVPRPAVSSSSLVGRDGDHRVTPRRTVGVRPRHAPASSSAAVVTCRVGLVVLVVLPHHQQSPRRFAARVALRLQVVRQEHGVGAIRRHQHPLQFLPVPGTSLPPVPPPELPATVGTIDVRLVQQSDSRGAGATAQCGVAEGVAGRKERRQGVLPPGVPEERFERGAGGTDGVLGGDGVAVPHPYDEAQGRQRRLLVLLLVALTIN